MKTEFLCRVSKYNDHWDDAEELSPDEPKRVVVGEVVDLPFDDSVIDWFQEGEGYLECSDEAGQVDIPNEGGYYWLTIGYSMDYEHNSVDFVWIETLTPATAEEVAEARATTCAQVAQDEEARLRAGCAFYGHRSWYDEPPGCQKKGHHDGGSWPACSRKDGQVCFDEDWKPLETARWAYPTNHFLDGTGVCRWAGRPYDPDFPGHELHPTPEEIVADLEERAVERAEGKGVDVGEFEVPSLPEIEALWDTEGEAAHGAGKIGFRVQLIKPWHTTYYVTPETARRYTLHPDWMTCTKCSGLPRYPGDCPFYEERPLARDEIILPVIYGKGWGRRYGWWFTVHKLDEPEPKTRGRRISQPPVWGRWYDGSSSEGDIQMWTVVGIPVTGMGWSSDEPNGRLARVRGKLQFHQRAFRKAKLTLDRLASEWRELHLVDDTVGEIILGHPGVMRAKTVNAVLTTLWRGLTDRDSEQWLRDVLRGDRWGRVYSMFPWEMGEDGSGWPDKYNLSALARRAFKKRLERSEFGWYSGHANASTDEYGPILFPAVVMSRRLRWVYGLVGAPGSIGTDGWHRYCLLEKKPGAKAGFVAAAGRRMTKDAYTRLMRAWRERYRKS